ncbi:hypothetical protein R6Q57_023581 [Mikania cordata]
MIDGEYPPKIITGGLPVTAFLNHFPEVALDLRVHQGTSLVDIALECDLTCCMMLPIFYRDSSQCLGGVECSMKHPALLLPIFNDLKCELKRNGLSMYHLEGRWPYKAIPGDVEPVKIEIEKGLKIACESHHLTLAQVWVSYTQMERAFCLLLVNNLVIEIFVVDIENSSSKCESRLVKILQGNRLSEMPQALKETRTLVGVKRKSIAGQSGLNQSNQYALTNINNPKGEDEEVDDDLDILSIYRNDAVLFFLPISSTFENLMEKLNKEFELDNDCKVEHEVLPGQWCSLKLENLDTDGVAERRIKEAKYVSQSGLSHKKRNDDLSHIATHMSTHT